MKDTNCPICDTKLAVKDATPCMECGIDDFELDHYKEHEYNEYEVYFGQRLILCDFCDVDFGSYDPVYFGFKKGQNLGFNDWSFIKKIDNKELRQTKFCPTCNYPLSFLKFVQACREKNGMI